MMALALGHLAGPIFPIFLTFSQYRVCYAAWNESIRLVTRRTSDQARKGKNCQRETYLPGSAYARLSSKDHERAAATGQAGIAVVIDGPSRRPRRASDLAPRSLHTDAHSIRRASNWGLLGLWAAAAPAGRGRGQRCFEQRPTQRNANCKTTRLPAGQPRPRT
jgi:hypothetical protein